MSLSPSLQGVLQYDPYSYALSILEGSHSCFLPFAFKIAFLKYASIEDANHHQIKKKKKTTRFFLKKFLKKTVN